MRSDQTPDELPPELADVKKLHWYTGKARRLWQKPQTKRRFRLPRSPLAIAATILICLLGAGMFGGAMETYQGHLTLLRDTTPPGCVIDMLEPARCLAGPQPEQTRPIAVVLPSAGRKIVREGTVELQVDDVPSAAIRIGAMVHPDQGEYVSHNKMWQAGNNHREAVITLRVRPERLDDVVRRIGELGVVMKQDIGSRDVTARFVDIEARLRNEKRVEIELLDLLAKRKDAPLKDILQVRQSIGEVRGKIEELTASRAGLAKLVALTTLTVNIYHKGKQADPESEYGLGKHFADAVSSGWEGALRFLVNSLGWLIRILVGGLPWLLLILLVVALVVRSLRKK